MSAWKHPATVIATLALFAALGGTAAFASGLISGKQIIRYSIPETKLTHGAIAALRAPTAISINKHVPGDVNLNKHLLISLDGVDVYYACSSISVGFSFDPHVHGDQVFMSGDYAANGTLSSIQSSSQGFGVGAANTLNFDVIVWSGSKGVLSRVDLGGYNGGGTAGCNIWGLITPGA
jgi:hypothetical protein